MYVQFKGTTYFFIFSVGYVDIYIVSYCCALAECFCTNNYIGTFVCPHRSWFRSPLCDDFFDSFDFLNLIS